MTTQQTLSVHLYRNGMRVDQIRDSVDADLHTVARELRHAGVLDPWDDPRTLAHLYHEYDYGSLAALADVFPDGPGPEMIRKRMERYGIEREERSLADRLADPEYGPEDIGLSPMVGDGRGEHA